MAKNPSVDSTKKNVVKRKPRASLKAEKKVGAKRGRPPKSKTSSEVSPTPSQPSETVEARSESVTVPQMTPSPQPPVKPITSLLGVAAYNEEKEIGPLIIKSREYFDRILVCDDGSGDLMGQIATGLGATVIRNETSLGRLAALRALLERSVEVDPALTVVMDVDPLIPPAEISKIVSPINSREADIVLGVKGVTGIPEGGGDDLGSIFMAFSQKSLKAFLSAPADVLGSRSGIAGVASGNGLILREVPIERQAEPLKLVEGGAQKIDDAQPAVEVTQKPGVIEVPKNKEMFPNLMDIMSSKPDLFFAIPGILLMASGLVAGYYMLTTYLNLHYMSFPAAFGMILGVISGLFLFMTSIILSALIKKS